MRRDTEDTATNNNLTSPNATSSSLFTQTGQNMRVIRKKIKRKKKRITTDKLNDNNDNFLTIRKSNKAGQAAKLIANSFEDQLKTDVSSETTESTTTLNSNNQLIDTTTNANTEVQFDDTTAGSDEDLNQKNKVTSTTINLNTMSNQNTRQDQVKGRMLAKKRKVMESITTTTTESSDSLIESSPDTSRGLEETSNLDGDSDNTYFNDNITDSTSPFIDDLDNNVRNSNRLKNAVRKKKIKSINNKNSRPALTSINSPFGDFTATFSTDENEEINTMKRKRKNKNRLVEPDESIENMHFRIDDIDGEDYDALNRDKGFGDRENDNDGFSNGFSNENTEGKLKLI